MKRISYFFLGIISLCLLCVAGYSIFIWIQSLQPKLVWEPLLIDESAFPKGWTKDEISNACISAALDSGCDNFEAKIVRFEFLNDRNSGAGEEIRFYKDKNAATQDLIEIQQSYFYQSSNITPYKTPDGLDYQSHVADQSYVGCTQYTDAPITLCHIIG